MGIALRSLHAAGACWPLPNWRRGGNICPSLPDHEMGVVCCHRCGKLNPSYPHMHWSAS